MSTIQGTSSASYAAQLQWLQSIQQNNQDPLLQQSGSDPMAFGLDPFTSNTTQTQPSGGSSGPPFSLGAMSALIDAQEQSSGASGLSNQQQKVFGELDTDGDGTVTKAEIENDFGSGNTQLADAVLSRLDTNGDGAISQSEFGAGTTRTMHHHHHMMMPPPDDSQGSDGAQGSQNAQDPLSQLLNATGAKGASSTSTSNSDGSTTTTITYADGSKVTMTSAATSTGTDGSSGSTSSSSTSSSSANGTQQNLLEQLIKMQSQLIQQMASSTSGSTSLATV